jgi:hypothetical protein
MLDRLKRAWAAFSDRPVDSFNHNQQMKVFTDRSREWLNIELAPRGIKLHLLTKDGVATHGEVTDRTAFQFKGWEPLPSTPQWMKEIR